jgi:hypothetical protein
MQNNYEDLLQDNYEDDIKKFRPQKVIPRVWYETLDIT